jgi:molybdate transport system substrate-binding protein
MPGLLGGCASQRSPSEPSPLQVSCAASLSAAVQQTAVIEGLTLRLNAGGSNTLVRQAELGAPTDLLLLADEGEARQKLLPRGYTLRLLASNRLVLVAPRAFPQSPRFGFEEAVAQAGELAVADPATAPLGSYTEQALEGLAAVKKVPLRDARAVLSAVALGHARAGIVYASDALGEPAVRVISEVPVQRHQPVRYVAVLPPRPDPSARKLVDSLLRGQGRQVLVSHGFLPPDEL